MAKKFLQLDNGKTIRIKVEEENGAITIKGYEEDGVDWYLISFKTDGTVCRHSEIDRSAGFAITRDGRIIESPE